MNYPYLCRESPPFSRIHCHHNPQSIVVGAFHFFRVTVFVSPGCSSTFSTPASKDVGNLGKRSDRYCNGRKTLSLPIQFLRYFFTSTPVKVKYSSTAVKAKVAVSIGSVAHNPVHPNILPQLAPDITTCRHYYLNKWYLYVEKFLSVNPYFQIFSKTQLLYQFRAYTQVFPLQSGQIWSVLSGTFGSISFCSAGTNFIMVTSASYAVSRESAVCFCRTDCPSFLSPWYFILNQWLVPPYIFL